MNISFCFGANAAQATTVVRRRGAFVVRSRRNAASRNDLAGRRGRGPNGTFTRRQLRNSLNRSNPNSVRARTLSVN